MEALTELSSLAGIRQWGLLNNAYSGPHGVTRAAQLPINITSLLCFSAMLAGAADTDTYISLVRSDNSSAIVSLDTSSENANYGPFTIHFFAICV